MRLGKYTYYLKSILNLLTKFENPGLILKLFLGISGDGFAEVALRGGDLRFIVRGPMDVWSIKETFIDRFYERFGTSLQDAERELILRTLESVDGNKQRTAEILGITSKTIRSKLRQYGYGTPDQPLED